MTGSLLDVCLALLLVSGAAVTIVGVDPPGGSHSASVRAGGVAETLAATTEPVEYALTRDGSSPSPEADRVAHATLAEHLAHAAVRSATFDGEPLSPALDGYRRAVRSAVADAIGPRTAVRAVWRPLPGVDLGGEVRVGPTPPPTATVSAARFTVPVGSSDPAERRTANGSNGDTTPSTTAAEATIEVLFPSERIAAAARDDSPAVDAVVERYRRAGEAVGVDTVAVLERGGPTAANRELAAAVADRVEGGQSLDEQCGQEPGATPGRVVVVVRTWSP
ncbi:DUF7284 family protein [Halobaculum marinum]|uniref:SIMPL domain-containing protein n=1 Tax=Halobaculum marinum TaxID=3031996 RepID=A0ABD5WY43_9EURY|nr:hypothetical protein [Halobaculum sp. DT55]